MIFSQFLRQLLILTGAVLIVVTAIHQLPGFAPHWPLSVAAIGIYTLLSVVIYQWGKMTAAAANKQLFTQASLLIVIIKMTLSVAIVVVYQRVADPQSRYYVLPFLLIYLIYTVYETWLLMRLGKTV